MIATLRWRRAVGLLLAFFLFCHYSVEAGTTGKIAGRIVDATTGEGLPGVNVVIDGTTAGATTDVDGYYAIIQVRPGTYSVKASFIGYATVIVEEVQVVVDKTTTVDFRLREEVVEGQEIVVTAERAIVELDRTTTTSVVDAQQLKALPVTNVVDAVNLQAGVVDGHFRGGRSDEVSYLVNGVPINNVYTNERAFDVEQNMVSSLEVISGVFNAEYGQALSGVVSIVTKDIADKWSGSILAYAGAIASSRRLEFVTRTGPAGTGLTGNDFVSERIKYYDAAEFPNQLNVETSFGGPIIRDKLGVQLTARYLDDNGHRIGRDLFSPGDVSIGLNTGAPRDSWSIQSTGTGDFVSLDATERVSINASTVYNLTNKVRLDYNVFLQKGDFLQYLHDYKYDPSGINDLKFFNQTHIFGLHFTMGRNAFATMSYSFLKDNTDEELYDTGCRAPSSGDPQEFKCILDDRYVRAEATGLQGSNAFYVAGNELFTNSQSTTTHTFVADYTRQAGRVHQFKAGVLARLHDLENQSFGIERSFRTFNLAVPSPNAFNNDTLSTHPVELAAYVQDKMEFAGLIVNAGLRFDYFDPDYEVPVDWAQGELEEIPDPNNSDQTIANRVLASSKHQVSPRIGIAFPISSAGVMRFSAGLFFQTPPLRLLYTNPEYETNPQSSTVQFGNPDLNPERTLAFEVGLQQGLTETMGLELTIFSKDVRNLTGQEIFRDPNGDNVVRWINTDYGTIRGLTFSLFQRPRGAVSWTLDYTLQFADGTASDPGEAFGRFQSGLEPILSLVRLDWDRRHVINNTITWSPNASLSVTAVNSLQSGTPYTTIRNFVVSNEKNNADKPTSFTTDLRLYYSPPLLPSEAQFFLQVQNLFDAKLQWAVYGDTGTADESVEKERLKRTGGEVGGVNTLDDYYYRQDWYGPPRKVSVGFSVRF